MPQRDTAQAFRRRPPGGSIAHRSDLDEARRKAVGMFFSPISAVYLSVAALDVVLAVLLWRRRDTAGAGELAGMVIAMAIWSAAVAGEEATFSASTRVLWSKAAYPGEAAGPAFFFLFAARYTMWPRALGRRVVAALWVIPAAVVALAFTNQWHHLVWSSIAPVGPAAPLRLRYGHGPAKLVLIGYSYILVLLAAFALLRWALAAHRPFRRQVWAVLLGIPLPLLASVAYVARISPAVELDLTPLAFSAAGLALAVGIYGLGFLDLRPVARNALVEIMSEGVLVLDSAGRVVDVNAAARALLAGLGRLQVGRRCPEPICELLQPVAVDDPVRAELAVPGTERVLQAHGSAIRDDERKAHGRLIVIHDITERRLAEREAERSRSALAERVVELERAVSHIRVLQTLLPICSYCKRIRSDNDYWQQLEGYLLEHSEIRFSHGICPDCYESHVKPQLDHPVSDTD